MAVRPGATPSSLLPEVQLARRFVVFDTDRNPNNYASVPPSVFEGETFCRIEVLS
ncbi:MAG TPA: hypothetical protein V6C85_37105 [Allocoleopsis sp.]